MSLALSLLGGAMPPMPTTLAAVNITEDFTYTTASGWNLLSSHPVSTGQIVDLIQVIEQTRLA